MTVGEGNMRFDLWAGIMDLSQLNKKDFQSPVTNWGGWTDPKSRPNKAL